jgi:hypothetical protein
MTFCQMHNIELQDTLYGKRWITMGEAVVACFKSLSRRDWRRPQSTFVRRAGLRFEIRFCMQSKNANHVLTIFGFPFFPSVPPVSTAFSNHSIVVVGYQRFGGPCCLHLHGKDGGDMTSLHGVTTEKTPTWIFIAMETSRLALSFLFFPSNEYPVKCLLVS